MFDMTSFLDKLVPEDDGPSPLTRRKMTVSALNADGTVDLVSGGVTIPGVAKLISASVWVGAQVQVVSHLGSLLVLGPTNGASSPGVAFTPALTATTTAPTLGTGGGTSGHYWREGSTVRVAERVVWGTAGVNAGSGDYRFSLPVAASGSLTASSGLGDGHPIGTATLRNNTTPGNSTGGIVQLVTSTTALILVPAGGAVGAAVPWAWGANFRINLMLSYPVA